jgi:hypothetical protein
MMKIRKNPEKSGKTSGNANHRKEWRLSLNGSIAFERRKISGNLDLMLTKPPKDDPKRSEENVQDHLIGN